MNGLKRSLLLVLALYMMLSVTLFAQLEIKLYPNGPKESTGISQKESYLRPDFLVNISEPRMVFYPAQKNESTAAVLICPGGGYAGVAFEHEGIAGAKWLNQLGISAFVLYYRMPNGHSAVPLTDAQTALKIIHKHAREWKIDENKIGIMGFSAGGHLASTVGTHFKNKIERPAFMILGYPVVSMDKKLTHQGSKENLLGQQPVEELVQLFSNELQVTKKTPPTFIFHAVDDSTVPVENSVRLYKALLDNNVVAELDTFAVGGHGFGIRKNGIPADNWPELVKTWLLKMNIISK